MNRLLVRFLLVLAIGAGLLYVYVATTGERDARLKELPIVETGPLGDMGTRVAGEDGRGVQVNPIRHIVITLLEKIDLTKTSGSFFRPIAELRGRKAEFKTPELQRITGALAVYELGGNLPEASAARRRMFEAVARYAPVSEVEAARSLQAGRRPPSPGRPELELTHLRIRAAEAILENRGSLQRVRFHGGPPDGVEITLFEAGARPVLELRTDRLTCTHPTGTGPTRFWITSPKRVRFYTPDGLHSLEGLGLWGRLEVSEHDGRTACGAFELHRRIRYVAARGFGGARPGRRRPGAREDRITVTGDGPAVLKLRQVPAGGGERSLFVDTLELHNAVHVHDRAGAASTRSGGVEQRDLELFCRRLRVHIQAEGIRAAEAQGKVRIRSVLQRTGGEGPVEHALEVRGERAFLHFADNVPRTVHVHAWSVRYVPIGFHLGGPLWLAVPRHEAPVVLGRFEDSSTEDARFQARADGDIVLESLDRDLAKQRVRLTLERNVLIDVGGVGQSGRDEGRGRAWLPGSSLIRVNDRFVLDYLAQANRLARFKATGGVQVETLLGSLRAAEIVGVVEDRGRWKLEAGGPARLEHPIASRTAPELARGLAAFSLTPPLAGIRPSESTGRIAIEGRHAVIEMYRAAREAGGGLQGRARFTGSVQVTQTEPLTDPIRLSCDDLGFRFARGAAGGAANAKPEPPTLIATGNVLVEAGEKIRVTGDRLRCTSGGSDAKGDARASGPRSRRHAELSGLPARITVEDREGNRGVLEGRFLILDAAARTARAQTGVLARFHPARGDFMLPGGAPAESAHLQAAEIEAERATLGWDARGRIRRFRAVDAVRIRGFAPAGRPHDSGGERVGRLLQWGQADELLYEDPEAAPAGGRRGAVAGRRLTLFGSLDEPARLAHRDPRRQPTDDILLVVPVLVLEGPARTAALTRVTGHGPGRIVIRSQDNLFSSSAGSGTAREKTLRVTFPNGFTMTRLQGDLCRLRFSGGAEVESRDRDGKLEAWLSARKELALLLHSAPRPGEDDLRVVERGYAEGNVRFRYREDTRGGCDRALWERGTNRLTLVGSPAWGERVGEGRQTFKKMIYNRATRRFELYHGSGRLRTRFERREEP